MKAFGVGIDIRTSREGPSEPQPPAPLLFPVCCAPSDAVSTWPQKQMRQVIKALRKGPPAQQGLMKAPRERRVPSRPISNTAAIRPSPTRKPGGEIVDLRPFPLTANFLRHQLLGLALSSQSVFLGRQCVRLSGRPNQARERVKQPVLTDARQQQTSPVAFAPLSVRR